MDEDEPGLQNPDTQNTASDDGEDDFVEEEEEEDVLEGSESDDAGDEIDAAMQDSGDDMDQDTDDNSENEEDGSDIDQSENEEMHEDMESNDDNIEKNDSNGEWEDIYGRKRSRDGGILNDDGADAIKTSVMSKYIPPALRNNVGSNDKKKELERLAKQIKGNLNRLAESNMHSIAVQIENMYGNNSRNDMNATLWSLVQVNFFFASTRILMTVSDLRSANVSFKGSFLVTTQFCQLQLVTKIISQTPHTSTILNHSLIRMFFK